MIPSRQENETQKSYAALCDYLRMGAGRSLAKLRQMYVEYTSEEPPTTHLRTLQTWSSRNGWQVRAEEYDLSVAEERRAEGAEYRRQIVEDGLALDYERVKELKALAVLLGSEILETDKRWLPDVKQIGSGEYAERVDIVRFNSALIDQFRGVLDDIAKEVGDRKQKGESEVTLNGGLSISDWRKEAKQSRKQASDTIADFEDESQ